LALIGMVLALLMLGLAPGHKNTALADKVQTVGHFGFFAIFALVITLTLRRACRSEKDRHSGWHYVLGLATTIAVGGLLEFAQEFIPRRLASWNDVAYDTLGAVAGISLLMAWDRWQARHARERIVALLACCLLVATALAGVWPLISCLRDYRYRQLAFPELMVFDQAWFERFLWIDDCVQLRTGDIPKTWPAGARLNVAAITVAPDEPFPGFGMKEPYPDWRHRRTLAFDILNPGSTPVAVGIRVQDFHHNEDYYDRFNRALEIQPGFQTVRIAVADIERGPRSRRLVMTRIDGIKWFLIRPAATTRLFVGNPRLE
jgi:VanZ family protein